MKKVLFVATVVKGHIMAFHLPYLKWFKDNGYETHVCARNDYEGSEICEIPFCDYHYDLPFERFPLKKNNLLVYKQLKEILMKNEFDIIHCHTPVGGAITRIASKNINLDKQVKVIYTAHGFHFYKGAPMINWLIYYPIEKWLASYTDVLITINKADYNIAKRFKAGKVKYVPGVGIDTKIQEDKSRKDSLRNNLNLQEKSLLVLSVGELNKNKNHSVIIEAIAKLKNPNIYYVICGEGPLENSLKQLARKLNIENQVSLLGYRNDINEISKNSDVFAFPSIREGLSLALMEAMAAGLPIIASDIRGNSDLIVEDKGGFLVQARNVEGYAHALNYLYHNQILKNSMGEFNKQKIVEFDLENIIEKMSRIYSC